MAARHSGDRVLIARIGAYESWKNTQDGSARTAPARRAFDERFVDEVDPERQLPEHERARQADMAKKAHFSRLALKSARSRRQAAQLEREADQADVELSAVDGGDDAA